MAAVFTAHCRRPCRPELAGATVVFENHSYEALAASWLKTSLPSATVTSIVPTASMLCLARRGRWSYSQRTRTTVMGMFQVEVKVANPADPTRSFTEKFWVDT